MVPLSVYLFNMRALWGFTMYSGKKYSVHKLKPRYFDTIPFDLKKQQLVIQYVD